jgi:ribosome-binding protein aMBF1 (putative translation factor)
MTLTEYVKRSQEEGKDISYSSIARDIPCDVSYIGKVARGEKFPSYEMAVRIERVTYGKVSRTNWYPQ